MKSSSKPQSHSTYLDVNIDSEEGGEQQCLPDSISKATVKTILRFTGRFTLSKFFMFTILTSSILVLLSFITFFKSNPHIINVVSRLVRDKYLSHALKNLPNYSLNGIKTGETTVDWGKVGRHIKSLSLPRLRMVGLRSNRIRQTLKASFIVTPIER